MENLEMISKQYADYDDTGIEVNDAKATGDLLNSPTGLSNEVGGHIYSDDEERSIDWHQYEDGGKCPVCLNEFENQQVGVPVCCRHTFCVDCILEWSKSTSLCPVDGTRFDGLKIYEQVGGPFLYHLAVEEQPCEEVNNDIKVACKICGSVEKEESLLICDGCDLGFHNECLQEPLPNVSLEWFCVNCQENRTEASSTTGFCRFVCRTAASERVRCRIADSRLCHATPDSTLDERIDAIVSEIMSNTGKRFRITTPLVMQQTEERKKYKIKKYNNNMEKIWKAGKSPTNNSQEIDCENIESGTGNDSSSLIAVDCDLSESAIQYNTPLPSLFSITSGSSPVALSPPPPMPDILSSIFLAEDMLLFPIPRALADGGATTNLNADDNKDNPIKMSCEITEQKDIDNSSIALSADAFTCKEEDSNADGSSNISAPLTPVSISKQIDLSIPNLSIASDDVHKSNVTGNDNISISPPQYMTTKQGEETNKSKKKTVKPNNSTSHIISNPKPRRILIRPVFNLPKATVAADDSKSIKSTDLKDTYDPFQPTEEDNIDIDIYDPFQPTLSDEERESITQEEKIGNLEVTQSPIVEDVDIDKKQQIMLNEKREKCSPTKPLHPLLSVSSVEFDVEEMLDSQLDAAVNSKKVIEKNEIEKILTPQEKSAEVIQVNDLDMFAEEELEKAATMSVPSPSLFGQQLWRQKVRKLSAAENVDEPIKLPGFENIEKTKPSIAPIKFKKFSRKIKTAFSSIDETVEESAPDKKVDNSAKDENAVEGMKSNCTGENAVLPLCNIAKEETKDEVVEIITTECEAENPCENSLPNDCIFITEEVLIESDGLSKSVETHDWDKLSPKTEPSRNSYHSSDNYSAKNSFPVHSNKKSPSKKKPRSRSRRSCSASSHKWHSPASSKSHSDHHYNHKSSSRKRSQSKSRWSARKRLKRSRSKSVHKQDRDIRRYEDDEENYRSTSQSLHRPQKSHAKNWHSSRTKQKYRSRSRSSRSREKYTRHHAKRSRTKSRERRTNRLTREASLSEKELKVVHKNDISDDILWLSQAPQDSSLLVSKDQQYSEEDCYVEKKTNSEKHLKSKKRKKFKSEVVSSPQMKEKVPKKKKKHKNLKDKYVTDEEIFSDSKPKSAKKKGKSRIKSELAIVKSGEVSSEDVKIKKHKLSKKKRKHQSPTPDVDFQQSVSFDHIFSEFDHHKRKKRKKKKESDKKKEVSCESSEETISVKKGHKKMKHKQPKRQSKRDSSSQELESDEKEVKPQKHSLDSFVFVDEDGKNTVIVCNDDASDTDSDSHMSDAICTNTTLLQTKRTSFDNDEKQSHLEDLHPTELYMPKAKEMDYIPTSSENIGFLLVPCQTISNNKNVVLTSESKSIETLEMTIDDLLEEPFNSVSVKDSSAEGATAENDFSVNNTRSQVISQTLDAKNSHHEVQDLQKVVIATSHSKSVDSLSEAIMRSPSPLSPSLLSPESSPNNPEKDGHISSIFLSSQEFKETPSYAETFLEQSRKRWQETLRNKSPHISSSQTPDDGSLFESAKSNTGLSEIIGENDVESSGGTKSTSSPGDRKGYIFSINEPIRSTPLSNPDEKGNLSSEDIFADSPEPCSNIDISSKQLDAVKVESLEVLDAAEIVSSADDKSENLNESNYLKTNLFDTDMRLLLQVSNSTKGKLNKDEKLPELKQESLSSDLLHTTESKPKLPLHKVKEGSSDENTKLKINDSELERKHFSDTLKSPNSLLEFGSQMSKPDEVQLLKHNKSRSSLHSRKKEPHDTKTFATSNKNLTHSSPTENKELHISKFPQCSSRTKSTGKSDILSKEKTVFQTNNIKSIQEDDHAPSVKGITKPCTKNNTCYHNQLGVDPPVLSSTATICDPANKARSKFSFESDKVTSVNYMKSSATKPISCDNKNNSKEDQASKASELYSPSCPMSPLSSSDDDDDHPATIGSNDSSVGAKLISKLFSFKMQEEETNCKASKDYENMLNPTQILNIIGLDPQQQSAAKDAIMTFAELSKKLQLGQILSNAGKSDPRRTRHRKETDGLSPVCIDDIESSAVEMYNKDKLKTVKRKKEFQRNVVAAAKEAIKPHYEKREVSKAQYKDIMKRAVTKICQTDKTMEVNPVKIRRLIRRYVESCQQENVKRKEKMRKALNQKVKKHVTEEPENIGSPPSPTGSPLIAPDSPMSLCIDEESFTGVTSSLLDQQPSKVVTYPELPLPPPPPPPHPPNFQM